MKLKEIKFYYNNGNLSQHYFEDKQGRKQGKYRSYCANGNKWYEVDFKNGLWNGKFIDYYTNKIWYYNNGKEISKEKYIKNKIQGLLK